jgi:hypothetical protein
MTAMLNKILIGACFTLCLSGCESSRPVPDAAKPAVADSAQRPPAGCVADTTSRLPVSPKDCPGFGRTWTDQDVKSTGATDAGQALRQLDPNVTITH